jgi:hypothetical protein
MSCQSKTLKYPFSGPYPFFGIIHPLFFIADLPLQAGLRRRYQRENTNMRGREEVGDGDGRRNESGNIQSAAYASQYTI